MKPESSKVCSYSKKLLKLNSYCTLLKSHVITGPVLVVDVEFDMNITGEDWFMPGLLIIINDFLLIAARKVPSMAEARHCKHMSGLLAASAFVKKRRACRRSSKS